MTKRTLMAITACVALAFAGCAPLAETPNETETTKAIPKMKMTTDIPASITTADKVETPLGTLGFFDGVPIGDTKEKVYDYMDRARAAQVFVATIPAVSTYSLLPGEPGHRCG